MIVDKTDLSILSMLQKDSKAKMKDIAEAIGMTITPVYERIKKLERNGILEKYTIQVNPKHLGYHLVAYCSVTLKEHSQKNLHLFEDGVQALQQVLECNHMSGSFDYLLKVVVKDMEDYQLFISNQLAALDNIGQVQSYFVMKSIKEKIFSCGDVIPEHR
ncbi:Lrp/AsnC family transcriptional regulator, leucine-responsive regulatory protein [Reichenbachiella faecimaris]|uniref:Lrp/AsnC family transcriptional regulator, leucine-responsive regulatory protein n=1 Tax=Reichenbachiella faecimaris TaxID=692418 RepID=A0A1W2G8F5_REIFA|nr:Lrp/AsnC family transcriptional regulator [Reichenbachiella faecimaris]SMD32712.1 Lrp/AsnC family transcriptional regulator, leucine-responsive regulatory protein [Reichenbachiella faecimaris]